jgi:hypothetical protein
MMIAANGAAIVSMKVSNDCAPVSNGEAGACANAAAGTLAHRQQERRLKRARRPPKLETWDAVMAHTESLFHSGGAVPLTGVIQPERTVPAWQSIRGVYRQSSTGLVAGV